MHAKRRPQKDEVNIIYKVCTALLSFLRHACLRNAIHGAAMAREAPPNHKTIPFLHILQKGGFCMSVFGETMFYLAVFLAALFLLRFIRRFLRFSLKLLWGSGLLLLLNSVAPAAFSLGISPFSIAVAYFFGLPGVGALLFLKHRLSG